MRDRPYASAPHFARPAVACSRLLITEICVAHIVLRPGDSLLLETHPFFVSTYRNNPEFFLVSGIEDSNPLRHDRAGVAGEPLLAVAAGVGSGAPGVEGLAAAEGIGAGCHRS